MIILIYFLQSAQIDFFFTDNVTRSIMCIAIILLEMIGIFAYFCMCAADYRIRLSLS